MNNYDKTFICMADCPDLDSEGTCHCLAVVQDEKDLPLRDCPCCKKPIWYRLESELQKEAGQVEQSCSTCAWKGNTCCKLIRDERNCVNNNFRFWEKEYEPEKVEFWQAFLAVLKPDIKVKSCVTGKEYSYVAELRFATNDELQGKWIILN